MLTSQVVISVVQKLNSKKMSAIGLLFFEFTFNKQELQIKYIIYSLFSIAT